MADHQKYKDLADRLITKHGRDLTFYTQVTMNGSTPWRPAASDITPIYSEILGVVLDYKEEEIDGTVVLRGDKRCLSQLTGVPDPRLLTFMVDSLDSATWRVISANPIAPGNLNITWKLQLRR